MNFDSVYSPNYRWTYYRDNDLISINKMGVEDKKQVENQVPEDEPEPVYQPEPHPHPVPEHENVPEPEPDVEPVPRDFIVEQSVNMNDNIYIDDYFHNNEEEQDEWNII